MKKYIVIIFSILLGNLIAQDAKIYLAQADLEDKIQSKVTTALSKMFDDLGVDKEMIDFDDFG